MKSVKYVVVVLLLTVIGLMSCMHGGKLSGLFVTPASQAILWGTNHQFRATAIFSDATMLDWTSAAKWTSSDETAVTVGNTFGTYGIATSVTGTGTYTITATDEANFVSGSAKLIVADPAFIVVTPANPFMVIGQKHQFNATALLAGVTPATMHDITSLATWSVSPEGIASITAHGIVTAVTGTTEPVVITASYPDSTGVFTKGTTTLTVTDTPLLLITVTPDGPTPLNLNQNLQFTAKGYYASATYPFTYSVEWSSSDKTVAAIDINTGLAVGLAAGTTTITAKDPITKMSATYDLTVQ